ncbi:ABC transporter permease [Streptomyces sp. NPDC001982]|uniref:ABC transporter permease n=1 Tax=Streptomyces sp. NPDC001982 TaxID=3154405 RepID=UPI0033341509
MSDRAGLKDVSSMDAARDEASPAERNANPSNVADSRLPRSGRFTSNLAISIYRVVGVVVFMLAWEATVRADLVEEQFLSPPSAVWASLRDLAEQGFLWGNVLATVKATAAGFASGIVVGAALGFIIGLSRPLSAFCSPFITMMNSTPRIALAPLFVLWFGIGMESRIVLVFSLVVFIILTNTIAGTESVDRDHLTLAKLNSASRLDVITRVALPSVLPWILAAMRVAFAYAIAGAVVGEMFLGQEGLGYLIVAGSGVFNVSQIFAALFVAVAIAFIADRLMALAERRLLRWRA